LYELTNNLSEMTTWGKPGTDLQNNILERLYGTYSGRLKNISPELASAQQAYSNLMNNIKQAGGFKTQGEINPRTIAQNLKNYNNSAQTLNGTAEAFRNIENSMPADYEKVLQQDEYLNAYTTVMIKSRQPNSAVCSLKSFLLLSPVLIILS